MTDNRTISEYDNKQIWVEDVGHPEWLKVWVAVWDDDGNTVYSEAMFRPGCFDLIMGQPHEPWSSMQDWSQAVFGDAIEYLQGD